MCDEDSAKPGEEELDELEPDEPEPLSRILQRWERRLERARQAMCLVGQDVCRLLLAHGASRLQAGYAGSEEQGAIHQLLTFRHGQPLTLPEEVQRDLYQFCYALLPAGWDIGKGSHGELQLDAPRGRLVRRHWWHVQIDELDQEILIV